MPAHAPSALPGPAISGIVHSERGPLAGVTVVIRGPVTLSFTTKAGGVFQFTGIPAGTYRLSATAPGYLPLSNSLVTTTAESPQTLTVLLDTAAGPAPEVAQSHLCEERVHVAGHAMVVLRRVA